MHLRLRLPLAEVEQLEDVVLDGLNARPIGLNLAQPVDVAALGLRRAGPQLGDLEVEVAGDHLSDCLAVLRT